MKNRIITIGEVARSIGMKPEKARAKLRKAGQDKVHGRWMFTALEAKIVRRILAEM